MKNSWAKTASSKRIDKKQHPAEKIRTDKKQHPAEKILEEEVSLVIDTAASTMSQEPYSAMFFIHKD